MIDECEWQVFRGITVQCAGPSEQETEIAILRPRCSEQGLRQRSRYKSDRAGAGDNPIPQRLGRGGNALVSQRHAGPGCEIRPEFPHRGIETETGQMASAIAWNNSEHAAMPEDQIQEIAMR